MKNIDKRPTFSQNLIKARKKIGISQIDLAEKTGLSRRVIAYYELKPVNPPIDKIEKIARVLGVKVADLIKVNDQDNDNESLDISKLDIRTIKKFKQILSLTTQERTMIYGFVDSLIEKKKKRQKRKKASTNPSPALRP